MSRRVGQNSNNKYCDYEPVNALLEQFEATAEQHHIQFIASVVMMYSLIDGAVLLKLLTTALEIGVELCDALPEGREKMIRVRGDFYPRWCIAVDASCRVDLRVEAEDGGEDILLDEYGGRDPRAVYLLDTPRAFGFGGYLQLYQGKYTFFLLAPEIDYLNIPLPN